LADVFLSYRNTPERLKLVSRLAHILLAYDIKVWWDYRLAIGESYSENIARELADARLVVPLWCTQSVASDWVLTEARIGKHKLFPARLQRCSLPGEFEHLHAASLIGWNGAADHPLLVNFVRELCKRLGKDPNARPDAIRELLSLPLLEPLPESDAPTKEEVKPTTPASQTRQWKCVKALTVHTDETRINAASFSPDGDYILAAVGSSVAFWYIPTGARVDKQRDDTTWGDAMWAEYARDGSKFLVTRQSGITKIFTVEGTRTIAILKEHKDRVQRARFSPDGTRVLTCSDDKTAKVWDAATGECLLTLSKHTDFVLGGAFSPDGRLIATGSTDGSVKIWTARRGDLVADWQKVGIVYTVDFSPDSSALLIASRGDNKVVDVASGGTVVSLGTRSSSAGRFSRDGRLIVTVEWPTPLTHVWDARSGEKLATLEAKQWSPTAEFSPDGTTIASVEGSTINLWRPA